MKISKKRISDTINVLIIDEIDMYDDKSIKNLKVIIKKLTIGKKYFFNFRSEDSDYLTDEEVLTYREKIPEYFKMHGKYELIKKLDNKRFSSIGWLPVNEEIGMHICDFWKYFYGMDFFSPNNQFNWGNYWEYFINMKNELYGEDIIRNKYSNSIFIKGHDGDNLIFSYGKEYDEKAIRDVEDYIGGI